MNAGCPEFGKSRMAGRTMNKSDGRIITTIRKEKDIQSGICISFYDGQKEDEYEVGTGGDDIVLHMVDHHNGRDQKESDS